MKGIAVIVAGGKGTRAGIDKVWQEACGKSVLERAAIPFINAPEIEDIYIVVAKNRVLDAEKLFAKYDFKNIFVLEGGGERADSVKNALFSIKNANPDSENIVVAIHDGARPYVTSSLVSRTISDAVTYGSAVPCVPIKDSLRKVEEGATKVVNRADYLLVQTPQCFIFDKIFSAYESEDGALDDATLYEKKYGEIHITEGDFSNEKITYLSDILKDVSRRVGVGFDVHPLVENRSLILGGVHIEHTKGLLGHSDADVLTHAIMDSLLTGAGLRDIGVYFPPNDDKYKDADSIELLKIVHDLIREQGFDVENISATIMAEAPRLSPYVPQMCKNLADSLNIGTERVSIAVTTTEKLGIIGEEKGIAAQSTALLIKTH